MKATTDLPILERLCRKLTSKRGISMYILAMVIFLCLLIALVGTLEASRLAIVVKGVRDAVESSITTTATSNAYNSYHGVREGNSGAYEPDGSGGWNETVTTADVVYKLRSLLKLKYKNGGYVHLNSDGTSFEYKISNINVEAEVTPLGNNKIQSTYHTTCVVEVPFSFGFGYLPNMRFNLEHQSTYVPRF